METLAIGSEVEYRYNKRCNWKRGRILNIEKGREKLPDYTCAIEVNVGQGVYRFEYWCKASDVRRWQS